MFKGCYNYFELEKEYKKIKQFIELKPKYIYKNKRDFLIEKERPISIDDVDVLLKFFRNKFENLNSETYLDLYRRELGFFDNFLNWKVDYFEDLKTVKFPFGLRDFVHFEIPRLYKEKSVMTSFDTFYNDVIKHTIENNKKKYGRHKPLDEKDYFTLNFVGPYQDKNWVKAVDYVYKRFTKQIFIPEMNGNTALNDNPALNEAYELVFIASMKVAYAGLMKEHYTKMIILTHPKVISGQIGVYRTNAVGDGLGIDFMFKNSFGNWSTIAVTSPNKPNKPCDIKFIFGKDAKKPECQEIIPNSWMYVPINFSYIYDKIEEFASKA